METPVISRQTRPVSSPFLTTSYLNRRSFDFSRTAVRSAVASRMAMGWRHPPASRQGRMTSPSRTFDHPAPAAACIRATRPEPWPGKALPPGWATVTLRRSSSGGAPSTRTAAAEPATTTAALAGLVPPPPPRPPGRASSGRETAGRCAPRRPGLLIWRSIEKQYGPDFVATGFAKSSLEGLAGRCPRRPTLANPLRAIATIPTAARTACTHNVSTRRLSRPVHLHPSPRQPTHQQTKKTHRFSPTARPAEDQRPAGQGLHHTVPERRAARSCRPWPTTSRDNGRLRIDAHPTADGAASVVHL